MPGSVYICTGHPHAALTWFKRYFARDFGFLLDRWSSERFQVRKTVQLPHCNSSAIVLEQAKQEALQAMVISQLGHHHGIPHLFGVCTGKAEFYKFYSFTLSMAKLLWHQQNHSRTAISKSPLIVQVFWETLAKCWLSFKVKGTYTMTVRGTTAS